MPIQGKVARILNERDLVINKGSIAGVKEGMIFAILESTIEITDPDSGDSLGSITREKIRIRIVDVEGQFSVGKTYETYRSGSYPASIAAVIGSPTKVRTLRLGINLSSSGDENDALVDIGDLAFEQERAK